MGLKLTPGSNLEAGLEFGRCDNGLEHGPEEPVQCRATARLLALVKAALDCDRLPETYMVDAGSPNQSEPHGGTS